jgi:NAD+-dependent protein deacetylase sirtuin 5
MPPPDSTTSDMPSTDIPSFVAHLNKSKRIVALLGAGLSASSGLPTFRGAGGFWRTYDATMLATPNAFRNDPGLVWQFYSYRRHMALNAKPNRAHLALAELARRNPDFITLSQNVDNLSPRAGHPAEQLKLLHGNLFDIKCWDEYRCGYSRKNDYTDPIVPALAIPADQAAVDAALQKGSKKAGHPFGSAFLESHIAKKNASVSDTGVSSSAPEPRAPGQGDPKKLPSVIARTHALIRGVDIADENIPIDTIPASELPQCPQCKKNLLRPGIVWFGEGLPEDVMDGVESFFSQKEPIDLMLVIGTSSKVYPAAGYSQIAKRKGARLAVINMDKEDARNLDSEDWFFEGDAAVLVPEILKSIIGEVDELKEGATAQL